MAALSKAAAALESYRGRDRLIRTLGYCCQLVGGILVERGPAQSEVGTRLLAVSAQLSHCRTVLRLFDDLAMFVYTKQYGLGPEEEDVFVRWVSVLGNMADQLYYPCEHLAWAADAKVLRVDSARWWTLSTTLWGLSLLLGIARGPLVSDVPGPCGRCRGCDRGCGAPRPSPAGCPAASGGPWRRRCGPRRSPPSATWRTWPTPCTGCHRASCGPAASPRGWWASWAPSPPCSASTRRPGLVARQMLPAPDVDEERVDELGLVEEPFPNTGNARPATVSLVKQPEGQARGWGERGAGKRLPRSQRGALSQDPSGGPLDSWALAVLVKATLGCWPPSHIQ
ncbi:peroxisomal membrane protein 11C isoform X1 [Lepus europaeus]|uniref:peroxisomal membrane protein 11C isoform X1 n=1 Tax=Lepus europaeus TaxID=9983 RepID=UPI002B45FFFC|nr:peroxisomal membrane protein 11C isoform X1 [Lepus europaeus]